MSSFVFLVISLLKSLPFMMNEGREGDDPVCNTGVGRSLWIGTGYRFDLLLLSGIQGHSWVEQFYKL